MSAAITVRDGSVYLPGTVVETYFRGIDAVVVLIREETLMVLPVRQATAGGCLLKLRNAAGDRVAQARDVFQDQGLLGLTLIDLPAYWVSDQGALCAVLSPHMKR